MNLLLDTHALVWWSAESHRLSRKAFAAIAEPDNTIWISAATAYEIALKHAMGRFPEAAFMALNWQETIAQLQFRELSITARHGLRAGALPRHHGDPFDRLLIGAALEDALTLVTNDSSITRYDVPVLW
jgi:PIN domain nuclease of toxin-antitoxin system